MSGLDDELRALAARGSLFERASRLAKFGAWECDLATEELTWTDGVYALFGLPIGARLRRPETVGLYDSASRKAMELARAEAIRTGEGFTLDARIRTLSGENRWMRLSAGVVWVDGRATRLFGAKQDITSEKQAWDHLSRRAERDALTGLANRAVFDARYHEITVGSAEGKVSALVLIDVDHFKKINDDLGHSSGDECLRQIGLRLLRVFKDTALVARIGGDEFAVLLPTPLLVSDIEQLLDRALSALSRPIFCDGKRIAPSVSIGASVVGYPQIRKTSSFFAEADAALYAAKTAGRGVVRIFGEDAVANGAGFCLEQTKVA